MLHIAICDDDLSFLDKLQHLLQISFSVYNCDILIEKFTNGKNLIESVEKKKKLYDIIFLDIEMPQLNGFTTADKLRQCSSDFLLVFTTNMDNEAPKGYFYQAFRFVLKKYLKRDIEESVQAIVFKLKDLALKDEMVTFKYKFENYFDYVKVKKKEIISLEISDRRIVLKTIYGEYDLLVLPLSEYKEILSDHNFEIVNRSYLINLDHVEDLDNNRVILTGDITVPIGFSKASQSAFKKKYMNYKYKMNYKSERI